MLISDAFAEQPPAATTSTAAATGSPTGTTAEPSPFASILPLILIFVVFYFLLIRPQQRKIKEHENMVTNIKRGDKVITGGGVVASVQKVDADNLHVDLEIAPNVVVKVLKQTIVSVIGKPEAAKEEPKEKETKKGKKADIATANDNQAG